MPRRRPTHPRLVRAGKAYCSSRKNRFYRLIAQGKNCAAISVWEHAMKRPCAWAKRAAQKQAPQVLKQCRLERR